MNRDLVQAFHLDAQGALTLRELCELSGAAESMVRELIDDGALRPLDARASTWTFSGECVVIARTARRLHGELELEPHAVSLVVELMQRIGELEAQLRSIRARTMR
ncbi:MAG: chaperone modulator CbpM [Pseudomonadota bacterium]|nr:chaperone modulator CbpM [Pseudomonadota bacterium]